MAGANHSTLVHATQQHCKIKFSSSWRSPKRRLLDIMMKHCWTLKKPVIDSLSRQPTTSFSTIFPLSSQDNANQSYACAATLFSYPVVSMNYVRTRSTYRCSVNNYHTYTVTRQVSIFSLIQAQSTQQRVIVIWNVELTKLTISQYKQCELITACADNQLNVSLFKVATHLQRDNAIVSFENCRKHTRSIRHRIVL